MRNYNDKAPMEKWIRVKEHKWLKQWPLTKPGKNGYQDIGAISTLNKD
jgi:hypothetical protein